MEPIGIDKLNGAGHKTPSNQGPEHFQNIIHKYVFVHELLLKQRHN